LDRLLLRLFIYLQVDDDVLPLHLSLSEEALGEELRLGIETLG
jgi:hypothetical protein